MFEFDGNNPLDLRFIPDDMDFKNPPQDVATINSLTPYLIRYWELLQAYHDEGTNDDDRTYDDEGTYGNDDDDRTNDDEGTYTHIKLFFPSWKGRDMVGILDGLALTSNLLSRKNLTM